MFGRTIGAYHGGFAFSTAIQLPMIFSALAHRTGRLASRMVGSCSWLKIEYSLRETPSGVIWRSYSIRRRAIVHVWRAVPLP